MNPHDFMLQGGRLVLAALIAMLVLAGCDGDTGPAGPPGPPGISAPPSATALDITINNVTIQSPPVVQFTVTNEDGIGFPGLTTGDLRFTIAKLMPGVYGSPSSWQSYIIRTQDAATGSPGEGTTIVQANRESGGTLVDNQNGSYTYTFKNDITNVVCDPPECVDADGNPLDLSYQPSLTHRLGIQTVGDLPMVNGLYTFVPATGAVVASGREIVKTEMCNECHNELEIHDARIETGYCVTCHNPGSTDPSSGNTVDFKVMVHKIHRGEFLPSVVAGGEYAIWGYSGKHDYSDVVFPQDIRNCTKCHDGSDPETPQGDAWQTPSIAACGSCHEDVDFSNHNGIPVTDDQCLSCHKPGFAPTVTEAHEIPAQLARANYQFNILDVTGGTTPSIQISVTDPISSTPYDLTTDPFTGNGARLAVIIGWGMTDFDNTGGTTQTGPPVDKPTAAMPISIDPVDACGAAPSDPDWTCTPDSPTPGIYTLARAPASPLPGTGTGRVGFEGHVAADFTTPTVFDDEVPVTSVVRDFVLTGTLTPRRQVVDIAKCDNCHDFLSLHGGNRNDEPAICVICHNPNATDIGRRPISTDTPVLTTTDGKVEEAIDFKTLIHGIHAGAQTNYDGSKAHGFREKGLVVWGYPGAPCDAFGDPLGSCEHDFSHVRFPGILQDCETCHLSGTYELEGIWEYPTTNGILSTTTSTLINTDPDDDLNISPTAAVCSSCHDSLLARSHMVVPGGALFGVIQDDISIAAGITPETCALCHGPGRSSDVEVVHAAR
jgi:OmcA/MtrC family decaheme c-type cytochrome